MRNFNHSLIGIIKEIMEAEMGQHLGYEKSARSNSDNARNGYKSKRVHSSYGNFEIEVPQDRHSTFAPQIVSKRQKDISTIDRKIISMYARGLSTRQISDTIEELYGFEVSDGFVSGVTDKILPQIQQWQSRPLDEVYPVVFIDATHYSVRDNGTVKKLAATIRDEVEEKWKKKYPHTMKSWRTNWEAIIPIFKFSPTLRKVIYTTNAIESLNVTYRQLNRQRSVFPNDTALLKTLYLATEQATKKWTMPIPNWGIIYGELSIMFEG